MLILARGQKKKTLKGFENGQGESKKSKNSMIKRGALIYYVIACKHALEYI